MMFTQFRNETTFIQLFKEKISLAIISRGVVYLNMNFIIGC